LNEELTEEIYITPPKRLATSIKDNEVFIKKGCLWTKAEWKKLEHKT